jgi:hypothetical protein
MPQDDTLPVDQPIEETPTVVDMSRIFVKFDAESLLTQLRALDVNNENSEKIVKLVRDQLLSHTDWTQTVDAPLASEVKQNFAIYRQTLRDITSHPDYPNNVTLPPIPSTK